MKPSIAVSDAGPIHYLALVDCADLLGALFERVLIPTAVHAELLHGRAPKKVKDWRASASVVGSLPAR